VAAIQSRWGNRLLSEFDSHHGDLLVQDWRRELKDTPSLANETLGVLKSFFDFARLKGLMGHNPAAQTKPMRPKRKYAHVFWTEEEIVRFRQVATRMGQRAVADFVELMALTGLGGQEAIDLRFSDVTEHIVYRPLLEKGRERRGLPAYPLLLEAKDFISNLRRRPRHTNSDTVLVDANCAPWGRAWVLGHVKAISEQAQIVDVELTSGETEATLKTPKALAKTWAIKAMRSGATDDDIVTLRRWHRSDVAALRVYADLQPQPDLEALSFAQST
jgi:integrase